MSQLFIAASAVSVLSLGMATLAHGATVGQYLFDSVANPTPLAEPYEEFADSSGNGYDIVKQYGYGVVSLSSSVPAAIGAGFSLDSAGGGAGDLVTVSNDDFSFGKTGQLTVEFWLNPNASATNYANLVLFNNQAANGWELYQQKDATGINVVGLLRNSANAFPGAITSAHIPYGQWSHVALTFERTGPGSAVANLYINGGSVSTVNYTPGASDYASIAGVLRIGADGDGNRANSFLIDELRISNVALLPGAGTGAGELAYNASLVPEPAALGFVIAGAGLLGRRRRIA